MYKKFYGFSCKPFSIVPNPDCLYMTSKHQLALTYLQYGIAENLGFILLTGDIGTGKTTLIRHILRQIDQDMEVAVIFNTQISGDQLIEMILSEYELTPERNNKSKNLDLLNAFLIAQYARQRKVLIIIDEAQNLSTEVLEEVRMLSNLQSESQMLLQIMLVGQPELKIKIKSPEMAQLTQRIAVNYHLGPLSKEEVSHYIAYRIEQAGGNAGLFTPESIEKIYTFSGGVPRSINLLCDAALVYGFADELQNISTEIIDQVVADKGGIGLQMQEQKFSEPEDHIHPPDEYPDQSLFPRIRNLENQVEKLTLQVQWQIEENEHRATSFKDDIIRTLKELINQERMTANATLVQYARMKEHYLRLKQKMNKLQKDHTIEEIQDNRQHLPEDKNPTSSSLEPTLAPPKWPWAMSFACMFVIAMAGIIFYRMY
ncbi:MAG: AAA family ATPase [Desulfoplanes sp.]